MEHLTPYFWRITERRVIWCWSGPTFNSDAYLMSFTDLSNNGKCFCVVIERLRDWLAIRLWNKAYKSRLCTKRRQFFDLLTNACHGLFPLLGMRRQKSGHAREINSP